MEEYKKILTDLFETVKIAVENAPNEDDMTNREIAIYSKLCDLYNEMTGI